MIDAIIYVFQPLSIPEDGPASHPDDTSLLSTSTPFTPISFSRYTIPSLSPVNHSLSLRMDLPHTLMIHHFYPHPLHSHLFIFLDTQSFSQPTQPLSAPEDGPASHPDDTSLLSTSTPFTPICLSRYTILLSAHSTIWG